MEFLQLVQKRYSVRAYQPDPVEPEILQKVLTAACLAPSAANCQPFRLIVITTRGKESLLRRIYNREWFVQAPLVICACSVQEEGWVRSDGKAYQDVDVAIAFDHLTLAAAELDLGTCWVASFDPEAARDVLGLPAGVEPIVFTPLGYPTDQAPIKERKSIEDLVKYEHW